MKAHGIGKGDRVGVYLPMCPTAAAVMLACARIGNFYFLTLFRRLCDDAIRWVLQVLSITLCLLALVLKLWENDCNNLKPKLYLLLIEYVIP